MEEDNEEQLQNSKVPKQLQPYMYKKGQTGNPNGRPEGISLKEYARLKFRRMTPEEREDFFEGMNKIDIFKMAEGNPVTEIDATIKEKTRQPSPEEVELDKEYDTKLKALILKNGASTNTTKDTENT